MKKLYTATVRSTGGREGQAVSSDKVLDVKLAMPKELGGAGGAATNPEQLFAAGYSSCFENAIRHIARLKKVTITESHVTANVDLYAHPSGGFMLGVQLKVELPGLARDVAQDLVTTAHQVCPYSNATRNNIEVAIELV